MSTITAVILPSRGFDPVPVAAMTLDEAKEAIAILANELDTLRINHQKTLDTWRFWRSYDPA